MEKEIPAEVRAFLENMLHESDEFGFGEQIPESVLWDLYGKLNERISTYLMAKLAPDKLSEYRQMREKNAAPEQLDVYLMKNIEDYKEIMKSAYKDFFDSYLEQVRENRMG